MEVQNKSSNIVALREEIEDLDKQMLQLEQQKDLIMLKRVELEREKQKLLPNAFEIIKSSLKRKRSEILDDPDFIALQKSLEKNLKKNDRRTYTENQKKIVVKLSKKYPKSEVARETEISINNIKCWKKKEKEDFVPKKRGKRVVYPELEENILSWIYSEREKKNHVSIRRLIAQGRKLMKSIKAEGLKFSWGWVSKFLKRNSLALKKPKAKIGKEIASLEKEVYNFKEKIKNLLETGNYDLDFVLNVDETGISTETTRTKTITTSQEKNEEKVSNVKETTVKSCNKEREMTTVLVGGTWSGKKLPAFIILKGKGVKKIKTILPKNVRVEYREKGSYMDRKTMEAWVRSIFKNYALKLPENKRGLLLIDGFKGHLSPEIEKDIRELRFDIQKFPADTTKYLQPMDLSVNRSLKNYYSQKWENYITSRTEKHLTKAGNIQAPRREDLVEWISWSWENVSETTVSNGFNVYKKHCITNSESDLSTQNNEEVKEVENEGLEIVMHKNQEGEFNMERIDEDNIEKTYFDSEDENLQNVFLDPESEESEDDELESKDEQNIPSIMSFDLLSYIIVKKEEKSI